MMDNSTALSTVNTTVNTLNFGYFENNLKFLKSFSIVNFLSIIILLIVCLIIVYILRYLYDEMRVQYNNFRFYQHVLAPSRRFEPEEEVHGDEMIELEEQELKAVKNINKNSGNIYSSKAIYAQKTANVLPSTSYAIDRISEVDENDESENCNQRVKLNKQQNDKLANGFKYHNRPLSKTLPVQCSGNFIQSEKFDKKVKNKNVQGAMMNDEKCMVKSQSFTTQMQLECELVNCDGNDINRNSSSKIKLQRKQLYKKQLKMKRSKSWDVKNQAANDVSLYRLHDLANDINVLDIDNQIY